MNRKIVITIVSIILTTVSVLFVFNWNRIGLEVSTNTPIKVGILHSLTGTMAISEKAVVDSTLLAIDEINQTGGILGRVINPVIVDGKSDLKTFAIEAERLIIGEKVSVVFGCWTSASRKTVRPIFERYKHLLFYPVQYEGLEESPNIVYTGATSNQQIVPAVNWCSNNIGKKFFLVGSDYIFPRIANTIIKDCIIANGGEIVGEEYLLLGSNDVGRIIQEIIKKEPDLILNTINGDSNIAFFKELRRAGITSAMTPTMSFSIGENEINAIGKSIMSGGFASWNYFQSIKTKENRNFVKMFKNKYGRDQAISDPMETAYLGVHIWANAVKAAKTDDVNKVRKTLQYQSFVAPEGVVHISNENNHMLKFARIGKIKDNGQFDIIWTSEKLIRPRPYPSYRTKEEWDKIALDFFNGWGGNWGAIN